MSDSESRPFQVGDKVTVFWGVAGVIALIDESPFNDVRPVKVSIPELGRLPFHYSEITLVEPVKQWRPLRNPLTRTKLGDLDRKITQLRADLDLAMEVADFWPDFEETQGMEQ